jgi:hypothetical protein
VVGFAGDCGILAATIGTPSQAAGDKIRGYRGSAFGIGAYFRENDVQTVKEQRPK